MIRMAHEGTSRVGNASVHWRKDGSGPAVVFLHGFPLAGETWDAVVHDLRDRFTCYAPDLIGLGRSHSTADDDYSSPGQARTFQELLPQLGVARYALVGNDTGGWIARELALIDRQRVSHLVRSGVVSEQDARVVATNPHDFALALGTSAIDPAPVPDELVVQGAVTDE